MAKKVVRRTSMVKSSLPSLEEVNQNIQEVTGQKESTPEKRMPIPIPESKTVKAPEVTKLVRLGEAIHTIAKTEASRRKMKLKQYMEYLIKKDNPDLF